MFLTIDKSSPDPIFMQIRAQIVEAIAEGQLQPGEPLPSVRSLAVDLGVNLHTVNKAYALLQDEGFVVMNGRKGTTVSSLLPSADTSRMKETEMRISQMLRKLATEYRACGGTEEMFSSIVHEAIAQSFDTRSTNRGKE